MPGILNEEIKTKQEIMILKNLHAVRMLFLLSFLFCTGILSGQCHNGKIISSDTETGIGYASIGIVGRDIGTVSDQEGNFSLTIKDGYDNDSLRISMIGYEPKCFLVSKFREHPQKDIYLNPMPYELNEVEVTYHRPKNVVLGESVQTNDLRSGFDCNNLGSELGIKVDLRKRVRLKDINLNVAICTYDSVTYRLNIYQSDNKTEYENILSEPIYISFTKDDINKVLTFDLSDHSIIVEGNVLIALELYRDMGNGKLLFNTQFFTGSTLHRKTCEGNWTTAPGAIGMYLNSNEIR